MNNIKTIDTEYLRANRTIETIVVKQGIFSKAFWIYNYEGIHYRVFENLLDVFNFLNNSIEPAHSFDNENKLDNFLLNCKIK
jgi:hypothetical protein